MGDFADESRKLGYSKEDEYFFKKDKEQIERLKQESAGRRAALEKEYQPKEYWMRCPKCGSALQEENYGDVVRIDRCGNSKCGGIYLDGGELEILLKAKGTLFKRIFGG